MSKKEFEKYYAENSGMTVEELHELDLHAYHCDCDAGNCKGWQMQHISIAKERKLDARL